MGKGKMDDAAAERIKKARGDKVSRDIVRVHPARGNADPTCLCSGAG